MCIYIYVCTLYTYVCVHIFVHITNFKHSVIYLENTNAKRQVGNSLDIQLNSEFIRQKCGLYKFFTQIHSDEFKYTDTLTLSEGFFLMVTFAYIALKMVRIQANAIAIYTDNITSNIKYDQRIFGQKIHIFERKINFGKEINVKPYQYTMLIHIYCYFR